MATNAEAIGHCREIAQHFRDESLRDDKDLEISVVNSLGREIHREFVSPGFIILKTRNPVWSDDHNKRVMEMAAAGASAARASVVFSRSVPAVRVQACKLGTPFLTTLMIRKNRLAKCDAAERLARLF